jgi:SanA protein
MTKRKTLFIFLILLAGLFLLTVFYCDKQVRAVAKDRTYSQIDKIPHNHVGLLLGTGKYTGGNFLNPYYQYRINAALTLLNAGKIDYLIISGDNSRQNYNEPAMMMMDLIVAGMDSTRIFLDYAGFRTFDSMVRLRELFSQDSVTIISQEFHNQRALYIAKKEGITAVGFNAQDVSVKAGLRTRVREKLARVKVFLDYLANTKPKFLGPKVTIP